MKARIYVDASVVGGCEDEEFSEYSVQLMERFATGELVLVVSALTVQELAGAPDEVRRHDAGGRTGVASNAGTQGSFPETSARQGCPPKNCKKMAPGPPWPSPAFAFVPV